MNGTSAAPHHVRVALLFYRFLAGKTGACRSTGYVYKRPRGRRPSKRACWPSAAARASASAPRRIFPPLRTFVRFVLLISNDYSRAFFARILFNS
ncbi:hypothetical protein EVAR_65183_1 [Eumeta japonica]|uniref:Uncharacterized protein n=1 Tax=Eumeta variegata TaxID=151549 RepID=A0A4C1ZJG2_EUMVA|nr:hypothetical protein EVAR_65183_1 [Eumeta japonica]